ncbi:hypothetical protein AWB81_01082 [Caballeronia arationis]|uniref:Ferritin-like domain-containing protein n=1 Tax=Caballeronia arationis TaxID=1777142 RepID=A0A7Z7N362_9BURK|nr:hypothetical protein AWB81_01082 [Caballeronia arationis]SOE65642.1 hypothetical protein SAMN05446927_2937 [Caballeronia arationis]
MFCELLLTTHNPYKPAVIDWPKLDPAALKRVTSLPIWDIAVQTEGRASIRVATYAASKDPLLREAITMNANEEARHKIVLSKLVEAYGIALAPEPPYPPPADALRAWMLTGYSECIDSFFAFGLFEAARTSGYFPEALVETFEPVIQEEARHILFFCELAGVVSAQSAVVPATVVLCQDLQRLDRADPRPRVACARLRQQRRGAGHELPGECRRFGGGRGVGGCADRPVSRRKRPPHGRLRRAPAAPDVRAEARAPRAAFHQVARFVSCSKRRDASSTSCRNCVSAAAFASGGCSATHSTSISSFAVVSI